MPSYRCSSPECGVGSNHVHMQLKNPRSSPEEEARRAWKHWQQTGQIPDDLCDEAKVELSLAITRSMADVERLLDRLGEADTDVPGHAR